MPFAAVNTTILVLSSVTCQLGVFAAERGQVGRTGSVFNVKGWGLREWFVLTYVMGAIFIAGQATEYAALVHEGVTIQDSAYGSMFYLTTGFHGLHVTGGLIAFLFVLGRTFVARSSPTSRPSAPSSCRTTGTSSTWCGSACSPRST